MAALPETHQESLKPHIGKGETAADTYVAVHDSSENGAGRTYLLTDRRFIKYRRQPDGSETYNSTLLDAVGAVNIRHIAAEEPDYIELMLGGLLALVGIVFIFIGVQADSESAEILMLIFGLGSAVVGLVLAVDAFETEDAKVQITLETNQGVTEVNLNFGEEQLELAHSISRAVSERH